jgi:hypothetical protein
VKSKVDADTGWTRLGRQFPRLALAGAAFAVAGCLIVPPKAGAGKSATNRALRAEPPLTIVIVTLDGVRWHEVFDGVDPALAKERGLPPEAVVAAAELMPNLHAIIDTHGVALGAPGHGATISASGPTFVSLPGYAELLSGRRATACHDNQCPGAGTRTIVDELAAGTTGRPDVAVITSWADIARVASVDARGALISSGRHGGATRAGFSEDAEERELLLRGEAATPAPGNGDFRPDALTADLALHHLHAHATRFLFMGLGEPDEYGHQGNYAGYLDALRRADARIAEIDVELQRLAARGTRTALFITADHGRADTFNEHGSKFPESARVWLVATGSALGTGGILAAPSERRLADLAPTVREIAGLPSDLDAAAGTPLDELLRRD